MNGTFVRARGLMPNDHFKLAGKMYRVTNVGPNAFGDIVIIARTVGKKRKKYTHLIVPSKMRFKVYTEA